MRVGVASTWQALTAGMGAMGVSWASTRVRTGVWSRLGRRLPGHAREKVIDTGRLVWRDALLLDPRIGTPVPVVRRVSRHPVPPHVVLANVVVQGVPERLILVPLPALRHSLDDYSAVRDNAHHRPTMHLSQAL